MAATAMCRPRGKRLFVSALTTVLIAAPLLTAQSNSNQPLPPAAPQAPPQAAAAAPPASPGKVQMLQQSPDAQPSSAAAQPAGPPPPFEVATIKVSKPDPEQSMLMFTPDGVSITGIPLTMIFREGFNAEDDHLIGLPSWVKSSRYDIEAKVSPEDAPKLKDMKFPQRRAMLVELLVDRFGLKYHRETRELPIYELVIAKGGVKMQPAKQQDSANARHMMMFGGPGKIESTAMKIEPLAHQLSRQLERTVVDKTGLTGEYDFTLSWTPDPTEPGEGPPGGPPDASGNSNDNTGGPTLFTAVEEQLGLKLVSAKGQEEVIVIDHIEQPSAN
ncbi:MAG: TIGR03435 family protein [Terracidiphilus sp.]